LWLNAHGVFARLTWRATASPPGGGSEKPERVHLGGSQLDAYIPDPPFGHRDPRFATQGRHHPPGDEKFTVADFTYAREHECYRCPGGKVLKLKARCHQIGNNLFRRYEADEADCRSCPLRERCLQTPEARRKHLAILIGKAKETLSQKMIAKIDTPAARAI
jgi:hypothetical protein